MGLEARLGAAQRAIEGAANHLGRAAAWLTGLMALVTVVVVVLRYGFDTGAIALQEFVLYLHAVVVLLGIPYTFLRNGHVRVDVLYSRWPPRRRALIDLLGNGLFLVPVSITLLWLLVPYVTASWRVLEASPEVGGIPAVFLLKTLMPVSALLLLGVGLADCARQWNTLRRRTSPSADAPERARDD